MHREWWPAGSMSVCRASTDKRLRRLAAYKNGYRRTDAMVRRTPLVLRNSNRCDKEWYQPKFF